METWLLQTDVRTHIDQQTLLKLILNQYLRNQGHARAGNHDDPDELRVLCQHWEHVHFSHGNSVIINGITFFGLGGETPNREKAPWSFSLSDQSAKELLSRCPKHSILITHTPPYGHCDQQNDGTHEGSQTITNLLQEKSLIGHFCGHIHAAWGNSSEINHCKIYNLGPSANWFELKQFNLETIFS